MSRSTKTDEQLLAASSGVHPVSSTSCEIAFFQSTSRPALVISNRPVSDMAMSGSLAFLSVVIGLPPRRMLPHVAVRRHQLLAPK